MGRGWYNPNGSRSYEIRYAYIGKDWDEDIYRAAVIEDILDNHPDFDIEKAEQINPNFLYQKIIDYGVFEQECSYEDLKEAIKSCVPKSFFFDGSWSRDAAYRDSERILYRNGLFEVRLVDDDQYWVVIFRVKNMDDYYPQEEAQIRNLANAQIDAQADKFFAKLHTEWGFDLFGGTHNLQWKDGVSQIERNELERLAA